MVRFSEKTKRIGENCLNISETETLVSRLLQEEQQETCAQPKEKKPRAIKVFHDVKLFINTLDRAVATMRKNGISADTIQSETEEYIEFVVGISKS